MDSDRLAPSIFGLLCILLRQYLRLYTLGAEGVLPKG